MIQKSIIALFILSLTACVSSKKFKNLQTENDSLKKSLSNCKQDLSDCEQKTNEIISEYKTKSAGHQSALDARDNKIKSMEDQLSYLQKTNTNLLDRLSDLSVVSKAGAESIKKTLDAINEKDKMIGEMTTGIQRKDSLNLALVMNLKRSLSDVSSEDINIEVKKGVVYISLSDKMLFRSGSASINDQAQSILSKIASVVNDHRDLEILVEGHTDNVPISTDCIADNWDLSTKRATAVVRTLQTKYQVDPGRMTAGGRSEYSPKADNSSGEGKKINRRTEIIILPKLDQFFKLMTPEIK
ncbi:MAG TPA: OmpA family protein [Saprospiraceae bacterium]|nr:OmpA family protein [Saprospiraceae bacterium]